MKFYILVCLAIITAFHLKGQVVFEKQIVEINFDGAIDDFGFEEASSRVYNVGSDTVKYFWRLHDENLFGEILMGVKDDNLCYLPGFLTSCPDHEVILPPGDSSFIYIWQVRPTQYNFTSDIYSAKVELLSYPNCDVVLDSVHFVLNILSSIKEDETESIKIWPNPFQSVINIQFESNSLEGRSIQVYDILGNLISQISSLERINKFDFNNLPEGMYFLHFYKKGVNILTKKIIKE